MFTEAMTMPVHNPMPKPARMIKGPSLMVGFVFDSSWLEIIFTIKYAKPKTTNGRENRYWVPNFSNASHGASGF